MATSTNKKIAPAAIVALAEALTNIYWYKSDLKRFLHSAVPFPEVLAQLNWDEPKRNVVQLLVGILDRRQSAFQAELLTLMTEVARLDDFSHLSQLEGGKEKAAKARTSVLALKRLYAGHSTLTEERSKIEQRREINAAKLQRTSAVQTEVEKLKLEYIALAWIIHEGARKRLKIRRGCSTKVHEHWVLANPASL